ncbi:MAG TPA: DUF2249 domain-containing protein [Ktedonobacterales bacterium]|nr:DUF2249 domain-containing protein [Ktedonobacterales bacterium]
MSDITQAIAAHHRELTDRLSAEVASVEDTRSNGEGLVAFLREELLPHAAGEEAHLYPRVDSLIKQHGDATATMKVDHEEIVRLTEEIERVAGELTAAQTTTERDERRRSLSRLGLQLEAILALHARKEEVVYLPLFARYLSSDEQRRILDDMHEQAAAASTDERVLDVRTVPPAQRHPLIFQTFDALGDGEAFVLLNDHDPKPLYYQLTAERSGKVNWEYVAQGPLEWQVRIGKSV